MSAQTIRCGKCLSEVPETSYNLSDFSPCPNCQRELRVEVFPARRWGLASSPASEDILTSEEAGCFYHPAKRASASCDTCGRFLCGLCDCEIGGQHLCPTCLEKGHSKGSIKRLENRRMLWDRIALALAIYPMLFFYATLITAPAAIFISIKYWNKPGSIIPRSKIRFIFALLIACLQLLGWLAIFGSIAYAIMERKNG